jgi:hypothetical protein
MPSFKHLLTTAAIVIVTMAIVNRVAVLKNLVG